MNHATSPLHRLPPLSLAASLLLLVGACTFDEDPSEPMSTASMEDTDGPMAVDTDAPEPSADTGDVPEGGSTGSPDPDPSSTGEGPTGTTGGDGSSTSGGTGGDTDGDTDGGTDGSSTGAAFDPCDEADPCIRGACYLDTTGDAACACEPGWGGTLCHECAEGFIRDPGSLDCVAAAACQPDTCGKGSCEVIDNQIQCTQVFEHTGDVQEWTVPDGVTWIDVVALGASGGCELGGRGAEASASIPTTPGEVLHVFVGGAGLCGTEGSLPGGFNGGGAKFTDVGDLWEGGSGGGATDLRRGGKTLEHRVIVAGAGGGQGWGGQAGHGGGLQGETCDGIGGGCIDETCGGRGGGQDKGGIGGLCFEECQGQPGDLGMGGDSAGCNAAGGGGGGGYYGGGGGAHCSGGGGSSKVDFAGNEKGSVEGGVWVGDGRLSVRWSV